MLDTLGLGALALLSICANSRSAANRLWPLTLATVSTPAARLWLAVCCTVSDRELPTWGDSRVACNSSGWLVLRVLSVRPLEPALRLKLLRLVVWADASSWLNQLLTRLLVLAAVVAMVIGALVPSL